MNYTFRLAEIGQVASKVFAAADGKKVWALHGQMGAGKTTFIHAVCENLGVTSAVGSPTYSIINEYTSPLHTIYHIDLYRLRNEEEALEAGVEECLQSGKLCFVEWPEKAPNLLPVDVFELHITVEDEQTRTITFA